MFTNFYEAINSSMLQIEQLMANAIEEKHCEESGIQYARLDGMVDAFAVALENLEDLSDIFMTDYEKISNPKKDDEGDLEDIEED
jgi:hypothetical protein